MKSVMFSYCIIVTKTLNLSYSGLNLSETENQNTFSTVYLGSNKHYQSYPKPKLGSDQDLIVHTFTATLVQAVVAALPESQLL